MSTRIIGKYLIIIMMLFPVVVCADFEITEIMYDLDGTDTNREWVEVKNTSNESTDLSKWYLFTDNTKHTFIPEGESIISSESYAVIAQNVSQFKTDNPNFTGILFDSSWTGLKNTGESISLKNPKLEIMSPVSFSSNQGGSGDGYSLQKIDGVWIGSKPTPGSLNILTKKTVPTPSNSTSEKTQIESKNKPAYAQGSGEAKPTSVQDSGEAKENNNVINLSEIKTITSKNKINILVSIYPFIGLFVVIVIGITAFLIVKKRESKTEGSDKKIKAEDITIIE